ncbi:hypothetical protein [Streptomyces sp. NBC_00239]|uniref:hypothetical protein n=1 Tax=Streptomyces sp. NBC_00239 TaxID=2903640 RepID=UPI002E2A5145|nr:hypothetical protein [Streptomyces sp. NBC_00239]
MRPGWEQRGDELYMVAQWRSAASQRLDVWIWLKDATGSKALYPADPPAIGYYNMTTGSAGFIKKQKIGVPLEKGRRYEVCIYVLPYKPNQPGPKISNPEVDGLMAGVLYE